MWQRTDMLSFRNTGALFKLNPALTITHLSFYNFTYYYEAQGRRLTRAKSHGATSRTELLEHKWAETPLMTIRTFVTYHCPFTIFGWCVSAEAVISKRNHIPESHTQMLWHKMKSALMSSSMQISQLRLENYYASFFCYFRQTSLLLHKYRLQT